MKNVRLTVNITEYEHIKMSKAININHGCQMFDKNCVCVKLCMCIGSDLRPRQLLQWLPRSSASHTCQSLGRGSTHRSERFPCSLQTNTYMSLHTLISQYICIHRDTYECTQASTHNTAALKPFPLHNTPTNKDS